MTNKEYTSLRITTATRVLLDNKKEHPRETYEDVILRLIGTGDRQ